MNLWVSISASFIFGWLAANIFRKLGGAILTYRLGAEFSGRTLQITGDIGSVIIKFKRPKLIDLLTVLLPAREQRFRARLRYESQYMTDGHEVTEKWYESPKWRETGTPEIVVNDCGDRILEMYETKHVYIPGDVIDAGVIHAFSCEGKLLPAKFKIDVWVESYSKTKPLHLVVTGSPMEPQPITNASDLSG